MAGRPRRQPYAPEGTLGHRCRAARLSNGLRVSAAAKKIGIAPGSLSDIESGVTKALKGETLMRLATVYQRSPEYLRTGIGSPVALAAETPEEAELLTLYRAVDADQRAAMLTDARSALAKRGATSAAMPFKPPVRAGPR